MKQLSHCAAALVLAVVASTAGAQAPPNAKQAYQRGDYATVIRTLLPGYRAGTLSDAESLRLLAYSCVNRGSGGLLGGLLGGRGKGGDGCYADSGPIMQAAAQAGDQTAMLSLVLAQGPHNGPAAMPGLPQDLSASHYWAVMASLLASTPKQAEDAQVQLRGHERFIPAEVREQARQRAEGDHPALLARARLMQPDLPDRLAAGGAAAGSASSGGSCTLAAFARRPVMRNGYQTSAGSIRYTTDPLWKEVPGTALAGGGHDDDCDAYCDDELGAAFVASACIERAGTIARFDHIDEVGGFQRMELDCSNGRHRALLLGSMTGENTVTIGDDEPDPRWSTPDTASALRQMVCR